MENIKFETNFDISFRDAHLPGCEDGSEEELLNCTIPEFFQNDMKIKSTRDHVFT